MAPCCPDNRYLIGAVVELSFRAAEAMQEAAMKGSAMTSSSRSQPGRRYSTVMVRAPLTCLRKSGASVATELMNGSLISDDW